ncbi:general substrate transporter [Hesseltinella vesiculosa]|uniref:General substrate transporter n=1 Tax=Hesseltinella vesiculosa TaxID=101127 RepID=A0A1X2G2C2_9FUNG|nr:general substrate transporter [Hesseltinella vesiculosa]
MSRSSITIYLLFVVFVIALSPFQYGYLTGELNTPQDVISKCRLKNDWIVQDDGAFLPPCLPMSDAQYSLIVAMLLAGGLIGALSASHYSDKYGRRQTLVYTTLFIGTGSLIMTFAWSPWMLFVGRFIAGIGSGMVTVVTPVYLAECVPKSSRGFFGTLTQLAIVIGIMVSQILGMFLVTMWRWILFVGAVVAFAQLFLLPFCVDSPKYLASRQGGTHQAKQALLRLRGSSLEDVEEEIEEWRRDSLVGPATTPDLMSSSNSSSSPLAPSSASSSNVTLMQFITTKRYRHGFFLVVLLQLSQQLSGINAVIFYSTSIMSSVFPDASDRITVLISVINLLMTLVSAYLMDRSGRRSLFLTSAVFMASSSILLGWSIENGQDRTSAFGIVAFVAAFAIGLGPIPFLMIPELVETHAVASAGSVGLATNMISNFMVSAGFMKLRDIIGNGQVFYVFAISLSLLLVLAFFYLPETKNKSADEVVRSGYAVHRWRGPAPNYQLLPAADVQQPVVLPTSYQ